MSAPVLAAISPQWIGIAVSAAIVLALLIILIVRRAADGKRDKGAETSAGADAGALVEVPGTPPGDGSFLDEPLQGGFEGLGRPVSGQPALGTIVMPKGPALQQPPQQAEPAAPPWASESYVTTRGPDAAAAPEPAPEPVSPEPAPEEAPRPIEPAPPEMPSSRPETGAAALSDIIVTTNQQEIDLTDPEVRQMLEELVANEIALAEAYRRQGQTLDAILQLTEAEKACTALGDAEQAERIKALMKELQQ